MWNQGGEHNMRASAAIGCTGMLAIAGPPGRRRNYLNKRFITTMVLAGIGGCLVAGTGV